MYLTNPPVNAGDDVSAENDKDAHDAGASHATTETFEKVVLIANFWGGRCEL